MRDLSNSETTDESIYLNRRHFLRKSLVTLASSTLGLGLTPFSQSQACEPALELAKLDEPLTSLADITHYNNYYEFSTTKEAVALLAADFKTEPWAIAIEGEVESPSTIDIDTLKKLCPIEERIYRFRCVEGWSMIIPWLGLPLRALISHVKPTSRAKYVEFISIEDKKQMIGQRRPTLEWPYREVLRIDEATHPLTLLATGLYGADLPPQNGAPLRLVVPWKYGYKSAKAITTIRFVEQAPKTSWQLASPSEYGFFANVNPSVAHPRWSQRREIRIGELRKRKTLPFNGYADQVANLYTGLDLKKNF